MRLIEGVLSGALLLAFLGLSTSSSSAALSGQALPDGILPFFAEDVPFALNQLALLNRSDPHNLLTGRLDLARVGIFGVSLGGRSALRNTGTVARTAISLI